MNSNTMPMEGRSVVPRPGDIVMFRHVWPGETSAEGREARPCLIVEIDVWGGRTFVTICRGESLDAAAYRSDDIVVRTSEGMRSASCETATRFVTASRIVVAVDHPGILVNKQGKSALGRLCTPDLARLDAFRAKLQASDDIAAEQWRERTEIAAGRFAVERRPSESRNRRTAAVARARRPRT